MCLAVPGRVVDVEGSEAVVDLDGIRRCVSTMLLAEPPEVDDWVIVHVGFAISLLDPAEAEATLDLLRTAADPTDRDG